MSGRARRGGYASLPEAVAAPPSGRTDDDVVPAARAPFARRRPAFEPLSIEEEEGPGVGPAAASTRSVAFFLAAVFLLNLISFEEAEGELGLRTEETAWKDASSGKPACLAPLSGRTSARMTFTAYGRGAAPWSEVGCVPSRLRRRPAGPAAAAYVGLGGAGRRRPPVAGFGGTLTNATKRNYEGLPEASRRRLESLLFSPADGLGYTLVRDGGDDAYEYLRGEAVAASSEPRISKVASEWMTSVEERWPNRVKAIVTPPSSPDEMSYPLRKDSSEECFRRYADYVKEFLSSLPFAVWGVTVRDFLPRICLRIDEIKYSNHTNDTHKDDNGTSEAFWKHHLHPTLRTHHPSVKILSYVRSSRHHLPFPPSLLRYLDGVIVHPAYSEPVSDVRQVLSDDRTVLNKQLAHCPRTGLSTLNRKLSWYRAEQYAHSILADLNAGSNGWMDWNFLLDAYGGPPPLPWFPLCDSPILAVPDRIVEAASEESSKVAFGFESTSSFAHGVSNERLADAMGYNLTDLERYGLIVQPMYHYVGHFSRFLPPGSRPVAAGFRASSNLTRAFASTERRGASTNLQARPGVAVELWPCEGSVRQMFEFDAGTGRIRTAHLDDVPGRDSGPLCVSRPVGGVASSGGAVLVRCDAEDAAEFRKEYREDEGPRRDGRRRRVRWKMTEEQTRREACLTFDLRTDDRASGVGGARLALGDCASSVPWVYDEIAQEIYSPIASSVYASRPNENDDDAMCLTTGWPFLQIGAFLLPSISNAAETNRTVEIAAIVLNEADDAVRLSLTRVTPSEGFEGPDRNEGRKDDNNEEEEDDTTLVFSSIAAHSIQTFRITMHGDGF